MNQQIPASLQFVRLALLIALGLTGMIVVIGWLGQWESAEPYAWTLRFLALMVFLLGLARLAHSKYSVRYDRQHRWGAGFDTPTLLDLKLNSQAHAQRLSRGVAHSTQQKPVAAWRFFQLSGLVGLFLCGFSYLVPAIL